jgi:hypothetical protein
MTLPISCTTALASLGFVVSTALSPATAIGQTFEASFTPKANGFSAQFCAPDQPCKQLQLQLPTFFQSNIEDDEEVLPSPPTTSLRLHVN